MRERAILFYKSIVEKVWRGVEKFERECFFPSLTSVLSVSDCLSEYDQVFTSASLRNSFIYTL